MALPEPAFPEALTDGNEQDTTYDGAADTQRAQAADYNEHSGEVIEMQRQLRGTVADYRGGAVLPAINKTGGALSLATPRMVGFGDRDATTGLLEVQNAAATTGAYRELVGLLMMEKGGDTDSVADGETCYVLIEGYAFELNTSAWSAENYLWLGAAGALSTTRVAGSPPVASVVVSHASNGILRILGSGLSGLHRQHLSGMMNDILTPAQITARADDYNPTGLAQAGLLRLSSNAAYDITGITAPLIHNVGTQLIITNINAVHILTLKNEDANSAAANRFSLDTDIALSSNDSCTLFYDSVSSRWKCSGWQRTSSGTSNQTRYFNWEQSNDSGDYRGKQVLSTAGARASFAVPDDFNSLVSLEVIGIISAQITDQNIDLASDYAAVGEDAQAHSETDAAFTVTSSAANEMFSYSIASVFSSLAAGDYCGIYVDHKTIGASITYLFIKLVYVPG